MSAQGELGTTLWQDTMAPGVRVVFEHQDEVTLVDPFQRLTDVALLWEFLAVAIVLHAGNDDMLVVALNGGVLIQ